MDIKDLKAQAYDLLAQLEYIQKQLQETNAKIGEEMQKQQYGEVEQLPAE